MATGIERSSSNERVIIWLVMVGMIIFSPIAAFLLVQAGYEVSIFLLAIGLIVTWMVSAGDYWWVTTPALVSLGGVFHFGFKIYAHEVALMIAFAPVLLKLATRWTNPNQGRSDPPKAVFIFFYYIMVHLMFGMINAKLNNLGGYGNLFRGYLNAYNPIIFFLIYYYYGSSSHYRLAIRFLYIIILFRFGCGLLQYYSPGMRWVPGINYILPGSGAAVGSSPDLRFSSISLSLLSMGFYTISRKPARKFFHIVVILFCFVASTFGSGRAMFVMLCLAPVAWFMIQKWFGGLIVVVMILTTGFAVLNTMPEVYDSLPPATQRSLSILVREKKMKEEVDENLKGSNQFHESLIEEGYRRWTENTFTLLFGRGLRPVRMDSVVEGDADYWKNLVENAANAGSFEKGLWNVLCIYGMFGMYLYICLFYYLLKDPVSDLMKNRICSIRHVIYFYAFYTTIYWFTMCWTQGGLPSGEMYMSLFSKVLYDDHKNSTKDPKIEPPPGALESVAIFLILLYFLSVYFLKSH